MRVNADAIPRRPAEEFVDRHSERLPLDVPEGLIDAAQDAGEDRAAAIEGVAVDCLPMVRDGARVFADQVRLDFFDGSGAGQCAAVVVVSSRRTFESRCFSAKPTPPRLASGAITQY